MEGFKVKMHFAWFKINILWKEKEARYLWNDALWYFHAWVVYSQCLDAFDVYNWRSAAQKPRNRARDWCFGQRQVNRHNSQSMHRRMPSENVQMRWKRIYNTHWRFNSSRLHTLIVFSYERWYGNGDRSVKVNLKMISTSCSSLWVGKTMSHSCLQSLLYF